MASRQWFLTWWAIALYVLIIAGTIIAFFWNDNSSPVKRYIQENIIEPVKEIIGIVDKEEIIDGPTSNNLTAANSDGGEDSIVAGGGSGGGDGGSGGGGASASTPVAPPDSILGSENFNSLEELFNFDNPVGNRVNIYGMAFQISGTDMYDHFFFTDDEEVMDNPVLMLVNGAEFHITVYNSLVNVDPQSIITVKGIVVDCEQDNDGTYCIKATSIE